MKLLTRLLGTAVDEDRPLNILGVSTHERYEFNLAACGHNHYVLTGHGLKEWDSTYAPIPPNYTILPPGRLPVDVAFDVVLCQSRAAHFGMLREIAAINRLPLICLEHVLPDPRWPSSTREKLLSMRGDLNVFISEYSRGEWGFEDGVVIEHGVDTDLFSPDPAYHRSATCLSVVNDWINRDAECGFRFWVEATRGIPVRVLGKTPGLSEPAASLDDLAYAYKSSLIFLNTALISPIPTVVLEAMSSGCCVISTRNPMLESIIEDGVNGYLVDDPGRMRELCTALLDAPEVAARVGMKGRRTILDRFGIDRSVEDWKRVFRAASEVVLEG